MNKTQLIRAISQDTNRTISQEKITVVLDTAVQVMKHALDSGDSVKWSGFGTLTVKNIPPKRLYSPVKKEYVLIESVRKIVFVEPRKQKSYSESMSILG